MSGAHANAARRIELIVREIDRLGTLSPIAQRLLEAATLDDIDIDELVCLLEMDPALSATLLRMCRSVERGLGDRVKTVRHAVTMLGLETVRSVVLGIEVLGVLQREQEERCTTGPGRGFDAVGFWKHAVATASAAELIGKRIGGAGLQAGEAFLSGLLHGLGRLVLHLVLPQAYDRALIAAEQRHCPSAVVERSLLGIDHHAAGRRLAERWSLPEGVRDVIWFHNQPVQAVPEANRRLVGIVTLARAICERHHLGWSGDFAPLRALAPLARQVGLDEGQIEALTPILVEEVAERCKILGLGEQTTPELLLGAVAEANRRLSATCASLDREVRALRRRARVAETISYFHECWCGDEPVEHTAECVAATAAHLWQPGLCAVMWWSEGQRWQMVRHGARLRSSASDGFDLSIDPRTLSQRLSALDGRSVEASGVLGSVCELPIAVADEKMLRVLPITIDRELIVMVLHDADVRGWQEASEVEPLRAVWSSAMRSASRLDRSRRLEDELAGANRVLAEMQAELAECESLARLGEMTAGAAHEMNNPLAVIRGRAQLLAARLAGSDLEPSVDALVRAADHMTSLITDLNRIACAKGPVIVEERLSDVIELAVQRAGERLERMPDLDLPATQGSLRLATDRELLAEALAELIVNAEQADSSTRVRVEFHEDPSVGRLYLRVVDRGRGMSERAIRHAFDPFFSEKPAGRQCGLGLARARRWIELLGGRIWHERPSEGGTIATIELSMRPDAAQAA